MTFLIHSLAEPSIYMDRKYEGTEEEYRNELGKSSTLYVGNLSFYTTEEQIYELFSKAGEIKRIIMGLDAHKKTPCGFCFVEYYYRQDALDCMKYINGTKLDERVIRTDLDPGYKADRNLGRGRSGGQVRDEYREDYDEGRGGVGARIREQQKRARDAKETYEDFTTVPEGATSSYYSRDHGDRRKRGREDGDSGPASQRRRDDGPRHNPRFQRKRSRTPEDE